MLGVVREMSCSRDWESRSSPLGLNWLLPTGFSCPLFLAFARAACSWLWLRRGKHTGSRFEDPAQDLAVFHLLVDSKVELGTWVRWVLRHLPKQRTTLFRWLDVKLVVAGERHDLAVQIKRVLAEHLLEVRRAQAS